MGSRFKDLGKDGRGGRNIRWQIKNHTLHLSTTQHLVLDCFWTVKIRSFFIYFLPSDIIPFPHRYILHILEQRPLGSNGDSCPLPTFERCPISRYISVLPNRHPQLSSAYDIGVSILDIFSVLTLIFLSFRNNITILWGTVASRESHK